MTVAVLYVVAAVAAWALPVSLTSVGERRRGGGWVVTVVAGVFFPLTWAVWYVRDERPYGVAH